MLLATLASLTFVTVAFGLWLRSLMPRRHNGVSANLLNSWLEEARSSGGRNSGVYIRVHGGAESLQVEVNGPPAQRDFVLVYPKAEWSVPFFDRVREKAVSCGLRLSYTPAGSPRQWDTMLIRLGNNVQPATNFVLSVITDIYGASLDSECRVSLVNYPRDPNQD